MLGRQGSAKVDPQQVNPDFLEKEKEKGEEEIDKASEIDKMRIQLKKFMQTSSIGRGYSDSLLVLSVLSSFQFIYQTYSNADNEITAGFDLVEKALAGLFSFDWGLSFFLADHKAEFAKR